MRYLILCLCLCSVCVCAQMPSQLLQNPSISWAAEFEMDIILAPQPDSLQTHSTLPLKRIMHPDSFAARLPAHEWLQAQLLNSIRTQKLQIFSDNALQVPASITKLNWNWENSFLFGYSLNATIYPMMPAACSRLRVRQIIYYDSVKVNWNLYTLSVGVGFGFGDDYPFVFNRSTPSYWIPVHSQLSAFNKSSVTWATRFTTGTQTHLNFEKAKILKGMNSPLIHFVEKVKSDSKIPLWTRNYHFPMTETQRTQLQMLTDTIHSFDPIIYEQKVRIIQNQISLDEIQALQLIQDWYWDDALGQLQVQLKEVAPIWSRYSPVFYRKTDE